MLTLAQVQNTESEAEANSAQAINMNIAIAAIRSAHPTWSYETARNFCRTQSPELFGLPPRGSADDAPASEETCNRDSASKARSRERKAAVEAYMTLNRCTYERAWNAVRRSRPSLFAPEPLEQDADVAPVVNRGNIFQENAGAIREGVWAIQDANPGMAYTIAYRKLRNEQPALFGLE